MKRTQRRSFWRHFHCFLESFCLFYRALFQANHWIPFLVIISNTMFWVFCFCIDFRVSGGISLKFLLDKGLRLVILMWFVTNAYIFWVICPSDCTFRRIIALSIEVRIIVGNLALFCWNSHRMVVFTFSGTCIIEINFVFFELISNMVTYFNLNK